MGMRRDWAEARVTGVRVLALLIAVSSTMFFGPVPTASAADCGMFGVSHQGKGTGHSANTIAAFQAAARAGMARIETDVFLTSDLVPLMNHQDNLGPFGRISEHTAAEIRERYRRSDGSVVPTLNEAFDAMRPFGTRWLIEIKRIMPWEVLHSRVVNNDMLQRAVFYSSSAYQVKKFDQAYPDIRIGLKVGPEMWGPWNVDSLSEVAEVVTVAPADLLEYPSRVRRFHENGVTVIVRRGDNLASMQGLGVDGAMTNDPAGFAEWCRL